MKEIQLVHGNTVRIDDEDFERVSQYKWHYDKHTGYARASVKAKWTFLHRFILNAKKGEFVDHIDLDKMNCTRANLRICTASENMANQRKPITNTSGYKGVSWNKEKKKFDAQIKIMKKHKHLGRFDDPKEAAKAYNKAAKEYFGEYAFLNEV